MLSYPGAFLALHLSISARISAASENLICLLFVWLMIVL